MLVYVVFMELFEDGVVKDWDAFGLYSTEEKAKQAIEWRYRGNGYYEGIPGKLYNRVGIDTRRIDNNLPKEENP